EAKTLLHQGDFHLVLCDWHMSPTNGLELLKYVRGEPAFKNLLFIFLTAEATKERVLEAIQAGVDGYMIKPVTVAQIQTKIYGLLLDRKVL
ncbi:MAG: response regulator, partial [Oligoflexia bacterium]|nr:response regulator [Oligoflexia bacterium]